MRNFHEDMENDPTSSRNYGGDPDDVTDGMSDMEEYAADFLDEENFDENSEFQNQEFSALNNQLDQLQSALDVLESRNADIHQELLQLLQSNREVRRIMTEEMKESPEEVEAAEPNSSNNTSTMANEASAASAPTNDPIPSASDSSSSTTSSSAPTVVAPSAEAANFFAEIDSKLTLSEPPSLAEMIEVTSSLIQSIDAIKLEKVAN